MRWVVKFVLACNLAVVMVLVIAWAAGGFAYVGVHGGAAIAFAVGVVIACEFLIALMALLFYSDRSGQDEAAYHVHQVDDSDRH